MERVSRGDSVRYVVARDWSQQWCVCDVRYVDGVVAVYRERWAADLDALARNVVDWLIGR